MLNLHTEDNVNTKYISAYRTVHLNHACETFVQSEIVSNRFKETNHIKYYTVNNQRSDVVLEESQGEDLTVVAIAKGS